MSQSPNSDFRASATSMAALALLGASAAAAPPTIHNVGLLGGGTYSRAAAVTRDGQVVTGVADLFSDKFWGDRAFRWTLAGGLQSLGTPTGLQWTAGNSISGVGNAVAGNAANRAFRWTSTGGMQNLGTLPGGTLALSYGISDDASVVVGMSNSPTGFWAFRWTPTGGMVNLGALPGGQSSSATAITGSGLIIVGSSGWSGAGSRAFRWASWGGFENLGVLTGGASSFAHGLSLNGEIVVGESDWSGTGRRATRWVGSIAVAQNLGAPPGATDSIAIATNDNGERVVGYAIHPAGRRAIMWNSAGGLVDLNGYLPSVGLPLTGWVLEEARDISGDGSVIVGHGTLNGQQRGFVVRGVPCTQWIPVVHAHPGNATVCITLQQPPSLQVYATGIGEITYSWQWREVGEPQFRPMVAGPNSVQQQAPRFVVVGNPTINWNQPTIQQITMGANLEFQGIATNGCGSAYTTNAVWTFCRADANCDGVVDFNDFLEFLNLYNSGDPRADLNGDSVVDFNDFLEFLNLYNAGC